MTTSPDSARARVARAFLHDRALATPDTTPRTLGHLTLLPHQESAVPALVRRLRRYRGALLADAPGLGKTFTALAVADALHVPRPLVLAPAALRTRWLDAARETGVRLRFRSIESLAHAGDTELPAHADRQAPPHGPPHAPRPRDPLVIVDEAHHLRTMHTRRWHAAAALLHDARVLLLTATPLHNRERDVAALAALFHVAPGSHDLRRLLQRITVRRTLGAIRATAPPATRDALAMPHAAPPRTITLPARDHATLHAIARLPALPSDDGPAGDARARLALVHAWCSSAAALAAMLRRRIARCHAIECALADGVAPHADVLRAFRATDDGRTTQLALAPLLAPAHPHHRTPGHAPDGRHAPHAPHARRARSGSPLATAIAPPRDTIAPPTDDARATARHRAALEALLAALRPHDDDARARSLRRLARWGAPPVVAFTRSRVTARALWRRLRAHPGIALLTGEEACIASGPVDRDALLAMLRDRHAPAARRVRLLLATDVASEGISMAGVRTVVHLDDPWTVARLVQRTGRAARLGAPAGIVRVVRLAPPADADAFARVERTLARKAGLVARVRGAVARGLDGEDEARVAEIAWRWCLPPPAPGHAGDTVRALHGGTRAHGGRRHARPDTPAPEGEPGAHADAWLVALRIGRRRVVRVVARDGRVRAPTLGDWRAADAARAHPRVGAAGADVHRTVRRAVARWWRARADPLDRAGGDRAADDPLLAELRRGVDRVLAGADAADRVACARGAARVRAAMRGGLSRSRLGVWRVHLADDRTCRRWLVAIGRRAAPVEHPLPPVAVPAPPRIVAIVPMADEARL